MAFDRPGKDGLVFTRELITPEVLASFNGKPVLDKPGDGRRIGTVVKAEVDDSGVWGTLQLDRAQLPHELAVSIGDVPGVKQ